MFIVISKVYGEGIEEILWEEKLKEVRLKEVLKEYTQVTIKQKAQQLKSILDKKPLDYSDLEDYMTEGQVLEFISKWEYKQVAKDFSEFMEN
jgi:hypothetical protein